MDVVCTEHHMRKPTVEIPPRRLLLSSKSFPSDSSSPRSPRKHNWNKSNKITSEHEEDNFNNEDNNKEIKEYCYDSDSDDPYASDHFRMFEFKIRRCTRSRSHDWTDCPFAHPGEKARRRDPRRFQYSGEVCPEFRRGGDCSRGDDCEFAHGVFECWLHPIRYRTEACKDGKHCKRKVCFFAHSPRQLRVLPPENVSGGSASPSPAAKNPCCLFCSSSPTSTLLGNLSHLSRSPSLSPPVSPAHKAAAFSRLRNRAASAVSAAAAAGSVNYKDVLSELVNSLDSMSLAEALQASSSSPVTTPVSAAAAAFASSCGLSNQRLHLQNLQPSSPLQFALSPSTPSYLTNSPQANFFSDDFTPRRRQMNDFTAMAAVREKTSIEDGSCGDPDLGWVNDLLT
ncbi:zinc finger (CCCH-type) family protein [Arabidopsis lyrata subsp. lyrata]|uniref:Zinc finger (CCCH-type) family protein n=2 Tax=Arabidopsis lyrata subsp. lyrata TaxID=81972 RepID=D7KD80_ARALL|nr:zinc finger (CCCH-type) family protein [Arabidopsis lyrata subsp. lyrata]